MRKHSFYPSLRGKLQAWIWPGLPQYKQTFRLGLGRPKLPETSVSQSILMMSLIKLHAIVQFANLQITISST